MILSKSYGLQNETRQYLRRLYAYGRELARPDINDIDNFVKGLKQLNIGKNYIVWLLKSQHNIGTGSILVPLGNLNGFQDNGTLVNSPTWGTTGITFTNDNHRIFTNLTMPLARVPRSWSVFGITNWIGPNTETVHHLFGCRSATAGTSPWQVGEYGNDNNIRGSFTSAPEATQVRVTGWKTICGKFDTQVANFSRQSAVNGSNNFNDQIAINNQINNLAWDNFHIGGGGPYNTTGRAYKGVISMVMIVDKFLTQTDYNNMRLLSQSTIGKDLGIA